MILSPNREKIDHRKLKEACECFNELIKMQESLDKYEKWSMANTIHETAIQLAESITEKLKQ
jgi:hypothetical protein